MKRVKKKVLARMLALLAATAVLIACEQQETYTPRYTHEYIETLSDGFTDTIEEYAAEEGMTIEEFQAVCEKSAVEMTARELDHMNNIRAKQLVPSENVLMQKVITLYDMDHYLSGEYLTPKGWTSICADVKQYVTTKDLYYGLRLDYEGTYFTLDEDFAVIRFFATNADEAVVPRSPVNGGEVEDPYPFGGAGFTTGTNGRMGSPEWQFLDFTVIKDGAELFRISANGTETLMGVYVAEAGRFVPADEL